MAFWSSADVEPKRNYRWKVTLDAFGADNILWWAKTVTTPSFDVSEVEHNFLDNKYYYPGRVSWNEVSLTLVDPISPDAVFLTNQIIEKSGYVIPGDDVFAATKETISKAKSIAAGFRNISIQVMNAAGETIETWTLNNPFIRSAKYGDLDYSSDDLRTVEMSIRYDWATCEVKGKLLPQFQKKSGTPTP